ncbi:hypothetical protein JCM19992_13670 [Thermostilla marina]
MSIGPLNPLAAGAAGTPFAQSAGSETDRVKTDAAKQDRQVQMDREAEAAAGVGETDGEDHETGERDADGRRIWEDTTQSPKDDAEDSETPRSKDASGQAGNLLDLCG